MIRMRLLRGMLTLVLAVGCSVLMLLPHSTTSAAQQQQQRVTVKIEIPGSTPPGKQNFSKQEEAKLKPITLTARNFGRHVGDGNVWLIEFYSPNCLHCVEFAPTYEEIARAYHSPSSIHKIKVGKVNGDTERALTSRFGIYAFPSFFIVDGFQVYSFEEGRTKKNLMKFAEKGFLDQDPIPFYASPMGPLGLMQGALIASGVVIGDLFTWSQKTFGLSPLITGGLLFGTIFMGCFFIIVFLAIFVTPKTKMD